MISCPYCGGRIKKRPEFARLSFKRRSILHRVLSAGPEGIPIEIIKESFFNGSSDTTIRTTLHYINKAIKPHKIDCHGGIMRMIKIADS